MKHIFCDLDGTLIVKGKVSDVDKKAIARFVDAGGHFHITSGRTIAEIERFMLEEGISASMRIGNNGCQIVEDGKLLQDKKIDIRAVSRLKDMTREFAAKSHFFEATIDGDVYYIEDALDARLLLYKNDNLIIEPNLFEKDLFHKGLIKMYFESSEDVIEEYVTMLDTHFADSISYYDDKDAINVGPKDISKGSALTFLKESYQDSHFISIGDGANDIPMFAVADTSFTFHHAKDFVKGHADHIVHNVAEAIDLLLAQ